MSGTLLCRKAYGCLAGGAIVDTLGRPVEGWHYKDIEAQKGRLARRVSELEQLTEGCGS